MYEQLQDMLNRALGNKAWKPRWQDDILEIDVRNVKDSMDTIEVIASNSRWFFVKSIHDLFSKDSWLMEVVEWKDNLWMFVIVGDWWKEKWRIKWNYTDYHYIIMWPMTATEKIIYFLNNAVV